MGAGAIQERSGRVPRAMVRGVLIALLLAPLQVALADTPLVAVPVASGLGTPIFATHAPGDTQRLFSVDLPGRIRIIDLSQEPAVVVATPFLDIATRVLYGGEQGLLGLAFHPAFASNGFFYVYYTSLAGHNVLSRFSVPSATPNAADPNSEVVLLDLAPPQANHRGGWIAFGPQDGYLYVAIGDGGGAGDTGTGHTAGTGNAQDLTNNLFGKILRIDVDGTNGPTGTYGIPPSNPHVGLPGDDEIWAHGLRNPWRESFDPLTGDLYIADVGQAVYEEVDLQPGASAGGENWGWRCREGAHDFNTLNCGGLVLLDPIHEYTHGGDPSRCAIIGGEIYRGTAIPDLAGTYFYADLCSSQIWSFRVVNGVALDHRERTAELASGGAVVDQIGSFGRDADGEIYVADSGGTLYRIEPAAPPVPVPATSALGSSALALGLALIAFAHLQAWGRASAAGARSSSG